MTRVEALVVIFVVAVFVLVLLLPALLASHRGGSRISCANNVKQALLSFQIWAGDNNGKFPMEISTNNGGTMELMDTADAWKTFQVMSNEIQNPRVLYCPQDAGHSVFPLAPGPLFLNSLATNFSADLKNHISYFIGVDASSNSPSAFLSGDGNFAIGGVPVKSGLLNLDSNTPVAWTANGHVSVATRWWLLKTKTAYGYIGLADGSVRQANNSMLTNLLRQTGRATNRLAIP